MLREGDTLVVWKSGRRGRFVKNLVDLAGKSLTGAIDTGAASGRFHVMASLAGMELEFIVERT